MALLIFTTAYLKSGFLLWSNSFFVLIFSFFIWDWFMQKMSMFLVLYTQLILPSPKFAFLSLNTCLLIVGIYISFFCLYQEGERDCASHRCSLNMCGSGRGTKGVFIIAHRSIHTFISENVMLRQIFTAVICYKIWYDQSYSVNM